jgi:hypothetical protein
MRTSRSSSLPESVVPPVSVVKKLGLQSFVEEASRAKCLIKDIII